MTDCSSDRICSRGVFRILPGAGVAAPQRDAAIRHVDENHARATLRPDRSLSAPPEPRCNCLRQAAN